MWPALASLFASQLCPWGLCPLPDRGQHHQPTLSFWTFLATQAHASPDPHWISSGFLPTVELISITRAMESVDYLKPVGVHVGAQVGGWSLKTACLRMGERQFNQGKLGAGDKGGTDAGATLWCYHWYAFYIIRSVDQYSESPITK